MPRQANTADQLLDEAQRLIQTVGYNAFSFRDLAESVNVKTASVHYHFPTKSDLGVALMRRYTDQLLEELDGISQRARTAKTKLTRFVDAYRRTLASGDRICVCGSLAAEINTLEPQLRDEVQRYFDLSVSWVEAVIREGFETGEWGYGPSDAPHPAALAKTLVSGLQGAMQFARVVGDDRLLKHVEHQHLSLLGV